MRILARLVGLLFIATVVWYGAWRWMLSDDVNRVRASLEYQNQQFKSVNRNVVVKYDSVYAYGFPFKFQVKVERPTVSMIDMRETFAVSLPEAVLERTDKAQGRYRVLLPTSFDALYAIDGQAPENYRVAMEPVPEVSLRAQANSTKCTGLPGTKPCDAVAADAPLITYAAKLPRAITLHMELNGMRRDAQFALMPLALPVFMDIPQNVGPALELFIGILREALVYKTVA